MILMEFLLAPTVPSEPRPQNLQLMVPSGSVSRGAPTGRDRWVTSSSMPMVKWFLGSSSSRLSNTAFSWAGVVSLLDRP